jgi:hypothetical protein
MQPFKVRNLSRKPVDELLPANLILLIFTHAVTLSGIEKPSDVDIRELSAQR